MFWALGLVTHRPSPTQSVYLSPMMTGYPFSLPFYKRGPRRLSAWATQLREGRELDSTLSVPTAPGDKSLCQPGPALASAPSWGLRSDGSQGP